MSTNHIHLNNIYYRQNKEIQEYRDIFLETDIGILKVYITCLDFVNINDLQSMNRLHEIDTLSKKYGNLYIEEVRRTYDNDMYFLISGEFILGVKYVLDSNFENNIQEFRVIENIYSSNKAELDHFNELDIVEVPASST